MRNRKGMEIIILSVRQTDKTYAAARRERETDETQVQQQMRAHGERQHGRG